jgi:hypothetical protein
MAYLNANIPPIYCQDKEGVSYMILKNIMEKAKTVWSSALASISWKSALISYHVTEWCGLL